MKLCIIINRNRLINVITSYNIGSYTLYVVKKTLSYKDCAIYYSQKYKTELLGYITNNFEKNETKNKK